MVPAVNEKKSSSRKFPRWIIVVGIWFVFGTLNGTQAMIAMRTEGVHRGLGRVFFYVVLSWMPWALFTPLVEWLGDRFPPVHWRPLSTWFIHLAACSLITAVYSCWMAWLRLLINPYGIHVAPPMFVIAKSIALYEFNVFLLLYGAIIAIRSYLRSQRWLAMREAETARLSEESLRRQLEPHFLFNTLNAIASLVRDKRSEDAITMVAALGDLLRHVLEGSRHTFVSLEEEMQFLGKYLELQKMRFADRLNITLDIPPDLLTARVPSLILQPMVENAVKHGIEKHRDGGVLRVTAEQLGETMVICVYNNGPRLPDDWESMPAGIGIANVRGRLELLFGSGWSFTLRNHRESGVETLLTIPLDIETL